MSYGTYTCLTDTGVLIGTTEIILFTDTRVPIGTTELILNLSIWEYP